MCSLSTALTTPLAELDATDELNHLRLLARVAQKASTALFVLSRTGVIVWVNDSFTRSNACDAMKDQKRSTQRLTIAVRQDTDRIGIVVSDTGSGMTPEATAGLWRFGVTTKRDGHGFGLHNAANAAGQLRATVRGHSEGPGRGSCFEVMLPLGGALVGET